MGLGKVPFSEIIKNPDKNSLSFEIDYNYLDSGLPSFIAALKKHGVPEYLISGSDKAMASVSKKNKRTSVNKGAIMAMGILDPSDLPT